jgi:16S rRNA (adenine1518-N6/adenine1519-N6)-dimethyltransferase
MDPAEIKKLPNLDPAALLRAHGLSPRKGLGQNFLVDDAALRQIVAAAEINPLDTVLEVGPGLGHLTRYLAACAGRVLAVELDAALLPALRAALAGSTNVSILQGDILKLDLTRLELPAGYLVVANIPYYITGELIPFLMEAPLKPARLVLTIQKEVADAICAGPGDLSIRALSVQVYGRPTIAARIPAGAFYPAPDVDSAVLRIDLYPQPLISPQRLVAFFQLIKAGFSQKRKTLRNSLAGGLGWKPQQAVALLQKAGIDPQRRAETLSLPEWERLVQEY